jgi:cobalamin biosynthesis Mg chelatase CobN
VLGDTYRVRILHKENTAIRATTRITRLSTKRKFVGDADLAAEAEAQLALENAKQATAQLALENAKEAEAEAISNNSTSSSNSSSNSSGSSSSSDRKKSRKSKKNKKAAKKDKKSKKSKKDKKNKKEKKEKKTRKASCTSIYIYIHMWGVDHALVVLRCVAFVF